MYQHLQTRIDGLDTILGGGIRYPEDAAAFAFIKGGPGSGKTLLALEMLCRAWLNGDDGTTYLYYSVEHTPDTLHKKLASDFEFYGSDATVEVLPREVPHRLCLEATNQKGTTRLILTHANPAALAQLGGKGMSVDAEWILAEIGSFKMAGPVQMMCLDNIGLLLTDLDYFEKRTALLETRRALLNAHIHGIFVQEDTGPADLRAPSPEEFSTDLLVQLSLRDEPGSFKVREIEILKARHQYYYRGGHHFSIAGKGMTRDVYLGARNERGPGIHIYPSVASQLSIARDKARFKVPQRSDEPMDLGHPHLNACFEAGSGPGTLSSTVLLAEPGTRPAYLSLRFLSTARNAGDTSLMVSTREDRDAIRRIMQRDDVLKPHLRDQPEEVATPAEEGLAVFHPDFRVLYLHPEFISPGKFVWDILRLAKGGHMRKDTTATRVAFDAIHKLQHRFPLITHESFLIPALVDLLRYNAITPWFVDLVPPGASNLQAGGFDPSPYIAAFDNVLLLSPGGCGKTGTVRVLKAMGCDFEPVPHKVEYAAG